jgi:deoxyribose-phosphate aldolase
MQDDRTRATALKALSLLDLTDLSDTCDDAAVSALLGDILTILGGQPAPAVPASY